METVVNEAEIKRPYIICPDCDSTNIEFYDTALDGESGRYKCRNCGRDTIWRKAILFDIEEFMRNLRNKRNFF